MTPAESMVVTADHNDPNWDLGQPFIRENVLHFPGGSPQTILPASQRKWVDSVYPWPTGTCQLVSTRPAAKYYPLQTLDLVAGFTPPFHIE
jgi:hypothetical protein